MSNFVNGLIFKPKHEKSPDFVKGKLSINVKNLLEWLDSQTGEWVNTEIKESKEKPGKFYIQVNENKSPEPAEPEPTDLPW